MKLHEYQAKELLRRHGVPVPPGQAAHTVDDAVKAAEALGGNFWVVKAQVHAGGRGKGRFKEVVDAATLAVELHATILEGEQRPVAANADVSPRRELGPALADDNGAGRDELGSKRIDAEALADAVTPVLGTALSLLVSHRK